MSDLITIKDARKLLGRKASRELSDVEVENIISQLDFIAGLVIKHYKKTLKEENPNEKQ